MHTRYIFDDSETVRSWVDHESGKFLSYVRTKLSHGRRTIVRSFIHRWHAKRWRLLPLFFFPHSSTSMIIDWLELLHNEKMPNKWANRTGCSTDLTSSIRFCEMSFSRDFFQACLFFSPSLFLRRRPGTIPARSSAHDYSKVSELLYQVF